MATYRPGNPESMQIINRLIKNKFSDLREANVEVGCLFAYASENSTAPPLSMNGWPAVAKVRVCSQKDRVAGMPDAQIMVDGEQWKNLRDRQKEALMAHELEHLEVQRGEGGTIKEDDCGRPKLKLKLHDFQIGVFKKNIEEYGEDSLDHAQLSPVAEYIQKLLPWG